MIVPLTSPSKNEVSPMSTSSSKKKKSKPLIEMPKTQMSSRRRARGVHSCSMSTLTQSTASSLTLGSEWDDRDSTYDLSIKSSVSSLNTSMYSPMCRTTNTMVVPIHDGLPSPYHKPQSNSSLYSEPESTYTKDSSQSSLSSFLSVLLEDEESALREIAIVSDNPRPEQQSVRQLRESFKRSASIKEKPKCRWEYLTGDNKDSRRKNGMGSRAASFSGFGDMASMKHSQKLRLPTRSNSGSTKGTTASEKARKKVKEGMFLRMPVRKGSPNSEASKKKLTRVNMSDTALLQLPMQLNTSSLHPPKMARRRSSIKKNSSNHSRGSRESFGDDIDDDELEFGHMGNATWNLADTKKSKPSNKLLGGLLVPASPMPSPAVTSKEVASLGKAKRSLTNDLESMSLLGESSSEEEALKDNESTLPIKKPLKRTSSRSKRISRRSSGSLRSTRSGSSLKRTKSGSSQRSSDRSITSTRSSSSKDSSKAGSSMKSSSSRRSRGKSPGKLRSRSKSPGALKPRRSRSKSPGKLKSRNRSKSPGELKPRRSRSKSPGSLRSLNRSKSPGEHKVRNRSKSPGPLKPRRHRSKSPGSLRSQNRSKSPGENKIRNRSKSPGPLKPRRSRSKSPGSLRSLNRSKSPGEHKIRNRSKSPGPLKPRRSRSKSPGSLRSRKATDSCEQTPELCDSRPPVLPNRFNSPPFLSPTNNNAKTSMSSITIDSVKSSTKSAKPLKKKKNHLPLSPMKNKVAVAPIVEDIPMELFSKPKVASSKSPSPRLSSRKKNTPETDRNPIQPRRGRWLSAFDNSVVPYETSTHSRTSIPYESTHTAPYSESSINTFESSTHSQRSTIQ